MKGQTITCLKSNIRTEISLPLTLALSVECSWQREHEKTGAALQETVLQNMFHYEE